MENFYESSKCKICNQLGESIYSKKYDDENIKFYLINYYGEKKYENFKDQISHVKYELLKCDDCKFIWQKYIPNENFSIDLYEKIIDNDESLKKSKKKYHNQKKSFYKEIKKIIGKFDEKKINILDFGAGWGHWLMSGLNLPYNSYAFELSPSKIKFLLLNKIKVLNFETINSYQNYFHYIRMDQVLEHLDKPNLTLEIIKKLGRKDCIFYISVPDGAKIINNKNKIIKIQKGPIQPLEHLNCFSKKSLKKILDKNGFRPLRLNEILMINLMDFNLDLASLKSLLLDIKNHFFSTSIKFKLKTR
jgi:2-polyprenyl-3-methyl-5-hydroxy-6-metoxy-1,4-benzoquinol methylase